MPGPSLAHGSSSSSSSSSVGERRPGARASIPLVSLVWSAGGGAQQPRSGLGGEGPSAARAGCSRRRLGGARRGAKGRLPGRVCLGRRRAARLRASAAVRRHHRFALVTVPARAGPALVGEAAADGGASLAGCTDFPCIYRGQVPVEQTRI